MTATVRSRTAAALLVTVTAAACISAWASSTAFAATVLVMGRNGHVTLKRDRFVRPADLTPAPNAVAEARASSASKGGVTVVSTLGHLRRTGAISGSTYSTDLGDFEAALRSERKLRGTRQANLESVTQTLHDIAVAGLLTPSRLPALFLTLNRNRTWWTSGPLLSYGQRVEFAGSQLEWEYYPGQGIQLTVLGNFAKADSACNAGVAFHTECRQVLSEMIPLAAQRAGGLTWEYYFSFDGGVPPWTSAMSQGTALLALSRGYQALGNPEYLAIAQRALPVFSVPPPTGVGVRTSLGMRFVQYTFAAARSEEIINAFLQTLIGLDTYAQVSHNPKAEQLFEAGNAEALGELPKFNTGAWSLYQPGLEDDLSYHELVTGFLQQLCSMTGTSLYCNTAADFEQDLKTPPVLRLLTSRLPKGRASTVYFTVSKISRVGIVVLRGDQTLFLTSADFSYGEHSFELPAIAGPGEYTIRLAATDLAGNFTRVAFPVSVVSH